MKATFSDWFHAPVFDDPEETRLAGVVHWILTSTLVAVLLASALAFSHPDPTPALLSFGLTVAVLLLSMWLLRRGHRDLSSTVFLAIGWAIVTFILIQDGSVRSPAIVAYPLLVLLAGVVRGVRVSFGVAALSAMTTLAVLLLEGRGLLSLADPAPPPARFWTGVVIAVVLSALVVRLVQQSLRRAEDNRARLEAQLQQSQRMEAVGRLAGGIAHDFNNYLTVILGNAAVIGDQLRENDKVRPALADIEAAADRSASLVHQLLTFSRNQPSSPKLIDPCRFVSEADRMLPRVIGAQIEFRTIGCEAIGCVRIDPALFEAALINLVVNARDAMPDGGTLTIELRRVDFGHAEDRGGFHLEPGPYVAIEVTDTGEGMSEAIKGQIFEPFFTTKAPGDGTGLGLAAVYGTVKQCGGSIEVESEPARGTTFRIHLPRIDDLPEDPALPLLPPTKSCVGSETVLLVEDEDRVRSFMADALRAQGYKTLEASDGLEAIELAERHEGAIDLLVTDVIMPRMGGIDLASRLGDARPDLKVLYVSGYAGIAPDAARLHESNPGLLTKPFTASVLLRHVHHCLQPAKKRARAPSYRSLESPGIER